MKESTSEHCNCNPLIWSPPNWSENFGDPVGELDALREFCVALADQNPEYCTLLNCFEDGYMSVDIVINCGAKVAEVMIVDSDDHIFGLFFRPNDDEFYFNTIDEGLEKFAQGLRMSHGKLI